MNKEIHSPKLLYGHWVHAKIQSNYSKNRVEFNFQNLEGGRGEKNDQSNKGKRRIIEKLYKVVIENKVKWKKNHKTTDTSKSAE